MRKTGWKKVVVAGIIMMSLGMILPFTSIQAEECSTEPIAVEEVSDGSISTYADQIVWCYRTVNGRVQKRRWNRTQGEWVDKKWIDVGPAA